MHSLPSALALVTTLAASASAHAQVNVATVLPRDRETGLAISAAPPDVGSKATVYVFTSQGYQKARDGENGFTCLVNRDSELGRLPRAQADVLGCARFAHHRSGHSRDRKAQGGRPISCRRDRRHVG